jgi:hypothetical protein
MPATTSNDVAAIHVKIVLFFDLRAPLFRVLFESQVRFDIAMRCLNALMTEPQRYDGDINSRLEKMHCTGVSNQMGSDVFVGKTSLSPAVK